ESVLGDWALQRQREIEGLEHEAELASFYTRLERVVLKLATLIQLAEEPRKLEISSLALADALNLVGWLQDGLRRLFADEFTFSRDMEDKQRVLRFIQKKPGIERRELLRLSHLKVSNFDPLLETLRQEGSVHEAKRPDNKRGFFPSPSSQAVTSEGVTPKVV